MTKCIVLGEIATKENAIKPIAFVKCVTLSCEFHDPASAPSDFEYIELVSRYYAGGLDLIFAYNDPSEREGVLYLGHWNDGVVK